MPDPVVIGLAVTSHTSVPTVAEFSNITVTGNVSAGWQLEAMTVEQPDQGAASVYLTVTDSAGQSLKVSHPDPAATNLTAWTLLNIPFSDMGSLNLASIRSVTFGVEDSGAVGTVLADFLHVSADVTPGNVWLEAEGADVLGASWRLVDDPNASGGVRMGSEGGVDGDDNNFAPGPEWLAAYNFDAPVAGVYNVILRGLELGGNSFWVRIVGSLAQSHEDPDQPGTGWVRFNDFQADDVLTWDKVHSDDHNEAIVTFVLPAGPLTLEIGKREDGTYVDAILITNDLGVDQSSLPDAIPAP